MGVVWRKEDSLIPSDFQGVQALRGIAALMVVGYHATQFWALPDPHAGVAQVWDNGRFGVDIFFVISGFVMMVSSRLKRVQAHAARRFLERRLVRIAPLYWLMTGVVVLKLVAEHLRPQLENGTQHAAVTFPYVVCSLLFIPFRDSSGSVLPPLIVGWTLSFEMFFYLLFAAALALKVRAEWFLLPVMLLLSTVGLFRQDNWPAVTVLANPMLMEFVAGVLIASALEKRWRLRTGPACAFLVVGFGVILIAPQVASTRWAWAVPALMASAIVLGTVMLEERLRTGLPSWMLRIGDASYSLYLSHLVVFSALLKPRIHFLGSINVRWWVEIVGVVALTVLATFVALVLYRNIEAPLNNALRRGLKLREARLQPASPAESPGT